MSEYDAVPAFLLKTKLPSKLERFGVTRYVPVGGQQEKRVVYLPYIVDETDAELPCRIYYDFMDASIVSKLCLDTGTLKFAHFTTLLQGTAADKWESAADTVPLPHNTDAKFFRVVRAWIAKYVDRTACNDLKEYLLGAKKVYNMSVTDTAERLKRIAKYMKLLPGAPNVGDVYSAVELKTALHRLMLPSWKTALQKATAGRSFLEDAAYTYEMMVEFYKVMEADERRTRARDSSGRGGRGRGTRFSRGGRGSGRSSYSGRGGRSTSDRQVTRRRSYEGEDYGPPAQRPRPDHYNANGRAFYGRGSGRGRFAGRYASPARGRGRFSGRGYSSGRGRGNNESHAIAETDSPAADSVPVEEATPQEEEEHQEHWVDEHFGQYDVDYGYDEDYDNYYGDY
jgi:hypothetical protein